MTWPKKARSIHWQVHSTASTHASPEVDIDSATFVERFAVTQTFIIGHCHCQRMWTPHSDEARLDSLERRRHSIPQLPACFFVFPSVPDCPTARLPDCPTARLPDP